jgi:hypothetical protein
MFDLTFDTGNSNDVHAMPLDAPSRAANACSIGGTGRSFEALEVVLVRVPRAFGKNE